MLDIYIFILILMCIIDLCLWQYTEIIFAITADFIISVIATTFHPMVDLGLTYEGIIRHLFLTAINTPTHLYSWAGLCNIGFASPVAPR